MLGAYVHKCARYEVSVVKPVARRTGHRYCVYVCACLYICVCVHVCV